MDNNTYGGFNTRRKRNIDLSAINERWARKQENSHSKAQHTDDKGSDEEVTPVTPDHDVISHDNLSGSAPEGHVNVMLGGQEIKVGPILNRPLLGEKLTVSVDSALLEAMRKLKTARFIPSFSWLVNESVRYYLTSRGTQINK